jgi:hypothetical protein
MAGNWIAGATKNKGGLHRSLGVPAGQKIPAGKIAAAAGSKNPKVAKEARLAQTLAKLRGGGKKSGFGIGKKMALALAFLFFFSALACADTPITTATGTYMATGQAAMSQTAALIKDSNGSRRSIIVCNSGSSTIYIAGTSGVTSSNGFPLTASFCVTLDRTQAAVYGICATGLTSTASFLEE